jgi:iron complex outermembrane receptor protein
MKKGLLLLTVFFIIVTAAMAQVHTVTGRVTSSEDDLGLPGVTVSIKGTLKGTVTDVNGDYSIPGVSVSDTLVFSFIGYKQQEVAVGDQKTIDVIMFQTVEELKEVVVTALGVKRQEREIGYSTEKIDADVVTRANAPNVINAMTGRAAGVQITQGDGVDGGSTRITIRGNNNLTGNNQPLIVVDNVPMENTPGLTNIGRGVDWGNSLADINPQDIENITIMKGGAASALYGSRGANGVVFITTKRGKQRKGIGVTFNYTYKLIHPYRFREMQNVYGHQGPISLTPPAFPMEGDTLLYPGIYGTDNLILNQEGATSSTTAEFGYYGSAVSWGPRMEGQMVKWWDGEMRPYSPQPDNYRSLFDNGSTQTYNLSASGGNEKGTLRVSLTRQDHHPIIENSNYDRTTINLGANLKISSKVDADLTFSYINYNRLNSPMLGDAQNSFNKGFLYSWPRSYQLIDKQNYELSNGIRNPQEGFPFLYIDKFLWWRYYKNNTVLHRDKYMGALTLTWDITPWLNVLGRIGRDFSLEQFETRNAPTDLIGLKDGYYGNSLTRNYSNIYEAFLTADKQNIFGSNLNVKFMLGTSRWDHSLYGIRGHSGKWYYPGMYTFFNLTETTYTTDENGNTIVVDPGNTAKSMAPGESISRERNNSVFAFLNLSFKKYLFVELTGRNDWSSTLPPGANSYFYPSISTSFIASEAFNNFQTKMPWFNFMKVRFGISQTATDTEPYRLDFYYETNMFGGQQTSRFPNVIPPFTLTPQRVNSYEGGVDLGFFDNAIDFDFTYYYMYSFSQILENLPVPHSSGALGITINEGELSNKGFEIILNTVPVKHLDFIFKTGINFARNRNRVESLGDNAKVIELANIWGLNGPAMVLQEGDEYGTISGYDYVYHENGNPIVNDAGTKYEITDTRVPIGNASPDFTAGWTMDFFYKGFRLSTLVDTKWGGDIYCGSYVIGLQTGISPETLKEREGGGLPYTDPDGNVRNVGIILDGVYADGTPNDKVVHYFYKYLPNAGGWGKFISTPGILEDTWVKVREISLSYTFPKLWMNRSKVFQNLTLSIVGRDLFYLYSSLPDKINPEGIMGSGNAQGFEWASLPGTMSVTFGISASF